MQPLRSYGPTLLVVAALLSGCTSSSADPEPGSSEQGTSSRAAGAEKVPTVVYMVKMHREQDRERAPLWYGVTPVSLPGTAVPPDALPADRERIADAVDALLDQPRGRHDTLWAGECAPGGGVSRVRVEHGLVTVLLTGTVPSSCERDLAMTALRAQQLAWTVVENSELPSTVDVRIVDGSGKASERFEAGSTWVVRR